MQEEKLIHRQLRAIRDEIEAVGKDHQNPILGYSYRSADDVLAAVKPLFIKHQVMVYSCFTLLRRDQYTGPKGNLILSTLLEGIWRFVAADGSMETVQTIGDGCDNADKGSGKAMTASEKYAYCQLLQITVAEVRRDIETEDYEIQASKHPTHSAPSASSKKPQLITKEDYEDLMRYAAQFHFDRKSAHAFLLKTFGDSHGLTNENFKDKFDVEMFAAAKVKFFETHMAEAK